MKLNAITFQHTPFNFCWLQCRVYYEPKLWLFPRSWHYLHEIPYRWVKKSQEALTLFLFEEIYFQLRLLWSYNFRLIINLPINYFIGKNRGLTNFDNIFDFVVKIGFLMLLNKILNYKDFSIWIIYYKDA